MILDSFYFSIRAVHYAVSEWEAICRNVNNGQAEIDNNTAECMMKLKYIADVLRKLISGETNCRALLPMNIAK